MESCLLVPNEPFYLWQWTVPLYHGTAQLSLNLDCIAPGVGRGFVGWYLVLEHKADSALIEEGWSRLAVKLKLEDRGAIIQGAGDIVKDLDGSARLPAFL